MNRFWNRYLAPMIQTIAPRRLMEVGADSGWNTRHILEYCRTYGAYAHIVDPAPRPALHDVLAGHRQEHSYYPVKSVEAIPQIDPCDVVLLDGDHNWATVYSELGLLFEHAYEAGQAPPVVLFHDVAWPYARRDMYYNPDDLEASQKHAYAYLGILPGQDALTEEGMNGVLANALHEGGPRNGVLTAIEDFIASHASSIALYKLPFFNGLGILIPEERSTPELKALVEGFFAADALLQACMDIERDSMHVRAMLQQSEARLVLRTEALQRARTALAAQAAELEILRAERALVQENAAEHRATRLHAVRE